MDVVAVRNQIVDALAERGFTPRDADGADFQREGDDSIRFKVGTSYQEVAVTFWTGRHQFGVTRITMDTERQITHALDMIDGAIPKPDTQILMTGDGEVVRAVEVVEE